MCLCVFMCLSTFPHKQYFTQAIFDTRAILKSKCLSILNFFRPVGTPRLKHQAGPTIYSPLEEELLDADRSHTCGIRTRPRFELGSLFPFPTMITIAP